MRTLVITPTYDEVGNIEEFLRRTRAAVPDADILVVDDASPDGTGARAEEVGAELGRVHVLHRSAKEGLGVAYRAGLGWGIDRDYELICHMDADLSHDPAALPVLISRLHDDPADLVIGSRYVPGGSIPHWPWFRRTLSKVGNLYAGLVLGTSVHDNTSGFRVYRASALRSIDYASTRSKGYGFMIETAYRVWQRGGTVSESPIAFTDRVRGYSKMTLRVAAEELLLVTWWGVRDRCARQVRRLRRS
ncbi:MAG: polyprenol monophosphomannose synthase [Actinobacteria bacterium]|nr:polyprenol monophosphomannose synthase [Actinomycetota bacterium]